MSTPRNRSLATYAPSARHATVHTVTRAPGSREKLSSRPSSFEQRRASSARRWAPGVALLALLGASFVACGDRADPRRSSASAFASASSAAPVSSASASASGAPPAASAAASSDEPSPAVIAACGRYAAAICDKEKACFGKRFDAEAGSVEACVARASARCASEMAPPRSGATADTIADCAQATVASCDALEGDPPASCHPEGTTALGAPCALGAQCASRYCDREADQRCGRCAALPKDHEACEKGVLCEYGSACEDGHCFRRVDVGEPCNASARCRAPLRCVRHECVAPAKEGEKCDRAEADAPQCDAAAGLVCSKAHTCAPRVARKLGERCDDDAICEAGARCGRKHVCEASAKEGDPCSPAGPFCDAPAVCFKGVCTKLSPVCP